MAPNDPLALLRAVLAATRAVEVSLDPLDVEAFETAVAAREPVLQRLESARAAGLFAFGDEAPPSRASLQAAVADLARTIREVEARNQNLTLAALSSLRDERRGLQAGRQALSGYRTSPSREARFADRKG